jgi:hypothetical protein
MIQPAGCARFSFEANDARRIVGERFRQNLDRHLPAQARVTRAVDFAHAAASERGVDLIATQHRARHEPHRSVF